LQVLPLSGVAPLCAVTALRHQPCRHLKTMLQMLSAGGTLN
jgi:hypothetical protein